MLLVVVAAILSSCSTSATDGEEAEDTATTRVPEGTPLPTVPTDQDLDLPDTCGVLDAAMISEALGFEVAATPGGVREATADDAVEYAAVPCTFEGTDGSVTVEIVATPDPDGYLSLVAEQAGHSGGVVVGDTDLGGLPESTLVVDHGDVRTYVVGGAGVYAVTGDPELASGLAVYLLDYL